MHPFFNHKQYPNLLFSFIEQSYRAIPIPFKPFYFYELIKIINFINANLQGLGFNSEQQNKSIKMVFNIIYQMSVSVNTIQEEHYDGFLINLKNYYLRHFSISSSTERKKDQKKQKKFRLKKMKS